jgi:peptidoglycan/xylan/chitin deacetylase (PgdA/CDA1 family)
VSRRARPLVLCYHAVSSSWPHALAVTAPALERQLRSLLARRYRPVGAADAIAGHGRLLHVTFDDAFRSVAAVLPMLERLRVRVTVFACPQYADEGLPLAVPELVGEVAEYPGDLATMDWEALRALAERGVEIGSHTLTHPHLTEVSASELQCELRDSRDRLEAELGRRCRFLAYPYGEHDARTRAAVRAAGYEAAFALPGDPMGADRFALPRVGVFRRDGLVRLTIQTAVPIRLRRRRVSAPASR